MESMCYNISMKRSEKSLLKQFFTSRIFLVVAFGVAVIIAIGYAKAYYQDYQVREQIKLFQDQVAGQKSKKFELLELINYVSSTAFVEEKARTELNMKKAGEQVVIVKNNDNTENSAQKSTNQTVDEKPLSNIVKWWYYFTHKQINN